MDINYAFKLGDTIRVIKEGFCYGSKGVIVDHTPKTLYTVRIPVLSDYWVTKMFNANEMELLTVTKSYFTIENTK